MPVQVLKVSDRLTRIVWTGKLKGDSIVHQRECQANACNETFVEKFVLDSFHQKCTSYVLDLLLYGVTYQRNDKDNSGKYRGSIELTLLPSITEDEFMKGIGNRETNLLEYHHQPSAIWASLNGGENISMMNGTKTFKHFWYGDGPFVLPATSLMTQLNLVVWVEFDNASCGEKNTLRHLTDMFTRQTHCDVDFIFEDDERIGGHRNILAARSPVFAAMFQEPYESSREVNIADIRLDIFKELLHYIYAGRISKPWTEAIAMPLYVAADKYNIGDLTKECVDFLLHCIRVDNVITFMVWAHLYSVDKLAVFINKL